MGDIDEQKQSETVRLVGRDESYAADVITEGGQNKLLVKATSISGVIGNRFTKFAEFGGSKEMNVDGSSTPVVFTIAAEVSDDLIVDSLIFEAFDSGIKIDKFLSLNSALTNGVVVEVKSDDIVFSFEAIRNSTEFDSLFSHGAGRSFSITNASGNDSLVARFGPTGSFAIRQQGTFASDDYIKVTISDDISNVNSFRFLSEGGKV